jgi:uncharacterized protein YabE (DUF348 family)
MLEKYGKNISLVLVFLGIGLIGLWLLLEPGQERTANTILVRSTGGLDPVFTSDRLPGNILLKAGIRLYPGDRIIVDGQMYEPDNTLPATNSRSMQIIPASRITVRHDDIVSLFYSSAPTLGEALWEAGFRLTSSDQVVPPVETILSGDTDVSLTPAREISVIDGEKTFSIYSTGTKVESALAENGLALTALDSTDPEPGDNLPTGKPVIIYRNQEEISLLEKTIPFDTENVTVDDLDAGTSEVIQQGLDGLEATRERVRIVNDKETSRQPEGSVIIREMVKKITNISSKSTASTINTDIGEMGCYFTAEVYATSYSPCRQGYDHCSTGTASGTPLAKGVIAVTQSWYRIFGGTQIFVPGYGVGTVGDTGGGIPGKYWIDLGYGEEDFVNWHQNVTVCFLNPAPANFAGVLP